MPGSVLAAEPASRWPAPPAAQNCRAALAFAFSAATPSPLASPSQVYRAPARLTLPNTSPRRSVPPARDAFLRACEEDPSWCARAAYERALPWTGVERARLEQRPWV